MAAGRLRPGRFALLELKAPIRSTSRSVVAVGDDFTLESSVLADTYNRRGGGSLIDCEASSVSAFLRDPLEIGGVEWEFTGLDADRHGQQ